jgi:hypothetical protein
MIVTIGLSGVDLVDPDDCTRFHVGVPAGTDPERAGDQLADAGAGYLADGAAFIGIDWLRGQAAGEVSADWADRFDSMLDFAASRGWLTTGRTHVRGHLEVCDGEQ